jgi:hypothetical protein
MDGLRIGTWLRPLRAGMVVAGALLLAACAQQAPVQAVAQSDAAPVEVRHAITGPTLIAFLPPAARDAKAEGAAEAQAHLRFALADTRRCLGAKVVRLETVFADRMLVHDGARTQVFTPDPLGLGMGAVLVDPGRRGMLVQSMVGASSLSYQLPQAVFDYWHVPACRRE